MSDVVQCPKCGTLSLKTEDDYCSRCGESFSNAQPDVSGNGLCGPIMLIFVALVFVAGVVIGVLL